MHRLLRTTVWISVLCFVAGFATPGFGQEPGKKSTSPKTAVSPAPEGKHEVDQVHDAEAGGGGHGVNMGADMPFFAVIPFVALLLSIAVMPLANGHWWEHNHNKAMVSLGLAVPVALFMLVRFQSAGMHQLLETVLEYVSFLLLLGSLFIISGGVYVRGSLAGKPEVNTALLALGALVASFVGTTGASMLLIRPLLRANASRPRVAHIVVFFIFTVSNCGGLLTPLGDPPLFLGFLKGVPFAWTFRLWKEWLFVNGCLLAIFYVWERLVWLRDAKELAVNQHDLPGTSEKLSIAGGHNILLLAGVVAAIYCSGNGIGTGGVPWRKGWQEGCMALLAATSYLSTSREIHRNNRFSFTPINEVAIVFAGIFVTMIPALLLLNANGKSLGVSEPWQFFWVSGLLSSVLDNAPTYLTFAATACGIHGVQVGDKPYLAEFLALPPSVRANELLAAISCGSVFMGANTYIGNGPNFMVKAIAEESGVKMPSFFGYMLYSGTILIPIFVLVTVVFFR